MVTDSVRRFLVTGPNENLGRFHAVVWLHLNGIERREQTAIYTCLAEHAEWALRAAGRADVTVQELEIADGEEVYPVRLLGTHGLTWVRPSLRANTQRIGLADAGSPTTKDVRDDPAR